jgi:hypothetical protein
MPYPSRQASGCVNWLGIGLNAAKDQIFSFLFHFACVRSRIEREVFFSANGQSDRKFMRIGRIGPVDNHRFSVDGPPTKLGECLLKFNPFEALRLEMKHSAA